MSILRFADDIAVEATNKEELKKAFNEMKDFLTENCQ